MLVLVKDFDVYFDLREYIIYPSLDAPGDVELDATDEQGGNLIGG